MLKFTSQYYKGVAINTAVYAKGTIIADETTGRLYVHDGSTVGGTAIAGGGFTPLNKSGDAMTGLFLEFAQDGIALTTGSTRAAATQLTAQTSRIISANAGNGIILPAAAAGLELIVINSAANPVQVYGLASDTIDGVAGATGVAQMVNSMCIYTSTTTGAWYSNGLGTGYAGALPTVSYTNAITAGAAATQSTATLLTTCINRVTTGASTASLQLPVAVAGLQITVLAATGNTVNVYANYAAGTPVDSINGGAATAAFAVANNKTATFFCAVNGQWHALLGA